MGIKVQWDNEEKTVLRWVFEEQWNKQDYYDVNDDLHKTLDTVSHKVNVILDMRKSRDLPKGFISTLRSEQFKQPHSNLGTMVSIGQNNFIRIFVNTFLRLYPTSATQFYMAESDEQAYAMFDKYKT